MPRLTEVLARSARRTPDRVAVVFGPETLTYAQLDERVNRLARELAARGLGKGDRMLLVAGDSDAFVVALYAGLRLGAIVVPVNPRSAAPEIDYFVTDSGATLLLFGPELAENVQAWRDLPVRSGDVPALALGAAAGFDDVLAGSLHQPADPLDVEVREDDDAHIIFGTTGPNGALFDQHRVLWVGINVAVGAGLREGERMLHVAPLYHSAALNMLLIGGMTYGATHVILPAFDPEKVLETLERERITMFFGVPTMYTFLLRSPSIGARDLSSLRVCVYGAAPMPAMTTLTAQAIVAALPDTTVIQACGQTEAGPGGILLQHDEVLAQPSASGRTAVPNTEVRIVDLEGHDVAPGGVGEMILRGETVMKRYWGKPEATAEVMRDGWLHTGDLALIDADGYITIVDRMKDMIITGGRNVYSAEVESALAGHPAVGGIAIIGRPSEDYGETVVAVVTPREGATLTLEQLREFGKPLLSPHKLPRDLVIAEIPRNPSGKILKHRVRAAIGG